MKSRLDMVNHDHDLNVAETILLDFKRLHFQYCLLNMPTIFSDFI